MSRASATGNQLLDRLPDDERKRLMSRAKVVSLTRGQVVFEQDGPMRHVYFPIESVCGIVLLAGEGKQVEGATVGSEGMVGIPAFLGVEFHPFKALVLYAGDAFQTPAASLLETAKPDSALDRMLRRYTLYRLRSSKQTGFCNTMHSVEQRMCRWLLTTHDRIKKQEFPMTHEFLAELLGVRRQTVSMVARALQHACLISYRRGVLRIENRDRLRAAACECYEVMARLYSRILGESAP